MEPQSNLCVDGHWFRTAQVCFPEENIEILEPFSSVLSLVHTSDITT